MTDSQLRRAVLDELLWEPSVNAGYIDCGAADGYVTLTGHAASLAEKLAAERAARRLYGVKCVANQIEVMPAAAARPTDAEIAAAGVSALHWDALVPDDQVTVSVRHGWVTLTGATDRQFQRTAAEKAVRRLSGVTGVTNDINLEARVLATEVKGKIEEALRRSAELDARRINVETQDGKVVLSGSVHSAHERFQAECSAWAAPGVTEIKNLLTVTP